MSNTLYDESGLPGALQHPEANTLGYLSAGHEGPQAGYPYAVLPGVISYGGAEMDAAAAFAQGPGETYLRELAPVKYADELYENQDYTMAPIGTAEAVNQTVSLMANPSYQPYQSREPLSRASDHQNIQTVIANVAQPAQQPPSSDAYLLSLLGGQ